MPARTASDAGSGRARVSVLDAHRSRLRPPSGHRADARCSGTSEWSRRDLVPHAGGSVEIPRHEVARGVPESERDGLAVARALPLPGRVLGPGPGDAPGDQRFVVGLRVVLLEPGRRARRGRLPVRGDVEGCAPLGVDDDLPAGDGRLLDGSAARVAVGRGGARCSCGSVPAGSARLRAPAVVAAWAVTSVAPVKRFCHRVSSGLYWSAAPPVQGLIDFGARSGGWPRVATHG